MATKCLEYIKKNPLGSVVSFFVLVLAYGFYATKYTVNVDQMVPSYYDGDTLITAGRWAATMIHCITNWMQFSPFWHTVMMMVLFWISGLCWISLFDRISNHSLDNKTLLVFWIFFPVYPMMAEQITYPVLNIALAYVLTPISLWMLYSVFFENNFKLKNLIIPIILMTISIDMYESFAAVYLVGISGVLILEYFYTDKFKEKPYKYLIKVLLKNAGFLAFVVILDFAISKLLCYIASGSFDFWYEANTTIHWFSYESLSDFMTGFLHPVIVHYFVMSAGSLSVFVFDCMFLFAGIFAIIKSVKNHSFMPLILFALLFISAVSLTFVIGAEISYRTEQALPVLVAFMLMILFKVFENKKVMSTALSVCLVLLALVETQSINNYAVRNYEIYEYEYEWMRDIGTELEKYDTDSKPVAFIYNKDAYLLPDTLRMPKKSTNPLYSGYRKLMCKMWDRLFISYDFDSESVIKSLNKRTTYYMFPYLERLAYLDHIIDEGYITMEHMGYDYIPCTKEQYEEAKKYLKPDDSSCKFAITETDDMIIVQLMSCE